MSDRCIRMHCSSYDSGGCTHPPLTQMQLRVQVEGVYSHTQSSTLVNSRHLCSCAKLHSREQKAFGGCFCSHAGFPHWQVEGANVVSSICISGRHLNSHVSGEHLRVLVLMGEASFVAHEAPFA